LIKTADNRFYFTLCTSHPLQSPLLKLL
jgi:hypothetical protein